MSTAGIGKVRGRAATRGRHYGRPSPRPDDRTRPAQRPAECSRGGRGRAVGKAAAPGAGQALVVVDGGRPRPVYALLRARAAGRRVVLVYVDADAGTRRKRLARDGIGAAATERVLAHSTETELPWLRSAADIVADG